MVFQYFDRLNYREYDFPEWSSRPSLNFMIAACHRSGSTWLACKLWKTGAAGAPWEYFNEDFCLRPLATRFGSTDFTEYLGALHRHRVSPNGVFGMKVVGSQWRLFKRCWEEAGESFPILHVIYVNRRDKIRQAVSHTRAVQTQQWSSLITARGSLCYDAQLLKRSYLLLSKQAENWAKVFQEQTWHPLTIYYEDMESDFPAQLGKIERHLGHSLSGDIPGLPMVEPQSDDISESWVERFKQEEADWLYQQVAVSGNASEQ